jgi:hypothetical protein
MRSSDCVVKLCSRRDRTSLSRSCALLNGVKPLIQGLEKAMLPDTGRATICLEVCSRLPIQANSLIHQTSTFVGTRAIPSLNSIRLDECIGDLSSTDQLTRLLLLQGVCVPIRSNILRFSGSPSEQEGPRFLIQLPDIKELQGQSEGSIGFLSHHLQCG